MIPGYISYQINNEFYITLLSEHSRLYICIFIFFNIKNNMFEYTIKKVKWIERICENRDIIIQCLFV